MATAARKTIDSASVAFAGSVEGIPGWVGQISGVIDFDERRTAFTIVDGEFRARVVFDGDDQYGTLPEDEDTWVHLDADISEPFGDPRLIFSRLRTVTDEERGEDETAQGITTTRYDFTIPAGHILTGLGLSPSLADLYEPDANAIAWIDENGLIRGLEFSAPGVTPDRELLVLRIEYSEHGTAPAVDLPDLADVIEYADYLDSVISSDELEPFEGVACYGDRVEECLAPNPAVQAMAQDPALCTGSEQRVCLVPVGNVRKDVVDSIIDFHKRTKNLDVVVLPSLAIPAALVTSDSQVADRDTLNLFRDEFGVTPEMPSSFIAITPIDMRPTDGEFGWFFGARYPRSSSFYNDGVFSMFRMVNVEPYSGEALTDEFIQGRVTRYFARYVANVYYDYDLEPDINYLNYHEMYGIGDLDEIQPNWPEGNPPCWHDGPAICIVPDMQWEDSRFESDLEVAVERLEQTLGIPVDVRRSSGFLPTLPSWSDEYRNDITNHLSPVVNRPDLVRIGVTDDALSQDASVPVHTDAAWPEDDIAIVSGFDAGTPGTPEHQERLYRLLLRAVARVHADQPLSSDAGSLLFEGITKPDQLDGKALPAIP